MRPVMRWALAGLVGGAILTGNVATADDNYGWGPGWRNSPGMMMGGGMMGEGWGWGAMGGYGPGMMMGGGMMGGGMMGFGGPAFQQLPADKQDQLRKLQVSAGQSMVALMAEMQIKAQALSEAMDKFPIDQAAAKKAHDGMGSVRAQMFALHLGTLAKAQQVVGKETWESLQSSRWGMGPGSSQGRGPGMMGPGTGGAPR